MKKLMLFAVIFILLTYICPITTLASELTSVSDNSVAINSYNLLVNLGVKIPAYEDLNGYVTRREFICTLVQLIGSDTIIDGTLPYSDIPDDSELKSALIYAMKLGIVSQADQFYPEQYITYIESYKMAVSTLNRDYEAISYGGYPIGYDIAASQCSLKKDLKNIKEEKLTAYDFYILLKNIGDANIMNMSEISDGNVKYSENSTVFETYFNLYEAKGIITANQYTSLFDSDITTAKGYIKIDDFSYMYSGDYTLGVRVKGYARTNKNGDDEIIYIESYKNNILTIPADNVNSYSAPSIKYQTDDGKENRADLISSPAVIYNGKANNKLLINEINLKDGYLQLIDNDDDGYYDCIHVCEYTVIQVENINEYDKVLFGKNNIVLDLSDVDSDYYFYDNGSQIDFDSITAGSLLTCYISSDRRLVKIFENHKTVSGKVESCDTISKTITIDGIEYQYHSYFETYSLRKVNIGSTQYFNATDDGILVALDGSASEMLYGYFMDIYKDDGVNKKLQIKLFDAKGTIDIYNTAKNALLNGIKTTDITSIYNCLTYHETPTRQLIRYKLDSDGNISAIDTQEDVGTLTGQEDDNNKLTLFEYPSNVNKTIWYIKSNSMVHPYFCISDSTVIFMVSTSEKEDDKCCRIMHKSDFIKNTSADSSKFFAYNVSTSGTAEAIVWIYDSALNSKINASSGSGLVESVKNAVAPDGERAIKIVIYHNSYFYKYYLTDEDVLKTLGDDTTFNNFPINNGDYVRFEADSKNYITAILKDFDVGESQLLTPFPGHLTDCTYYYGKVYTRENNMVNIMPENISGITPNAGDASSRYSFLLKGNLTVYDTITKKIYDGSMNDIVTYLQNNELYGKLLLKTVNGVVEDAILYK